FTYSKEESEDITSRLKRLKSGFKKLSVARLGEKEYEESRLISRWVKGELFALEHLEDNRGNPLLYYWIVDEALWGLPSRTAPPHDGELAAYLQRLDKIPKLLRQASILVVNPARPHTKLASKLIRNQLASLPALEIVLDKRYGAEASLPEGLSRSITGFLGFLEGTLSSQTRGNLIFGSENISRIFRYDESIDINIGGTIEEAEKGIRRFKTEVTRMQRSVVIPDRPYHPIKEDERPILERVLETVQGNFAGNSFPENIRISDRGAVAPTGSIRGPLMKSRNLTLHPMSVKAVSLVTTGPFHRGDCVHHLLADEGRSKTELIYESLKELTLARPIEMLCQGTDTVRAIFPSEIYAGVVRFIEIEKLIDLFPTEKPALLKSLLKEKIRALALTIVVLKLHAGTLTTESAALYLEETAGLSADEAAGNVLTATYAPTIAYPGISILEIDRLRKHSTVRRAAVRTDERLHGVLMDLYFMPIPDIYAQLP
ncbi:MAG: hypothetical protein KAX13_01570, partial [Candidatus Krumholzibacteria bacterium]|nr:hypothetical protein [Candidatus Krumholzibacteria bacterium]